MIISVVFVANKNPWMIGDDIIKWAEHLDYSHTAIIVHNERGSFVYESAFPRFKKTPLLEWEEHYEIKEKFNFEISESKTQQDILDFCDDCVGIPYSVFQLVIIGVGILSAPFGKLIGDSYGTGSKYLICTEFVGLFMERFFNVKWDTSPDLLKLRVVREETKRLKGV